MNPTHEITSGGISDDAWSPQSKDGWVDSISAPVDSRVWTGGLWLENSDFEANASLHDSYFDRRHHRGVNVDPAKLRFASEEKPYPKPGFGGFLPFGQHKPDDEEESSDYKSKEPEIDIDAILKDTTIQPSVKSKDAFSQIWSPE